LKDKAAEFFTLLKLFPLIGSAALFYLVLLKQTFVFQKYTVYMYSVAIDTNIYKETSRLELTSWKNLTPLLLDLLAQDLRGD